MKGKDHRTVCKPNDEEDPSFVIPAQFILKELEKIRSLDDCTAEKIVAKARWVDRLRGLSQKQNWRVCVQTINQTNNQSNNQTNKQGIKQTNKELGDDPAVLVGLVFAWLLFLHALIATARTVRTAVVLSVVVTILVKRSIVSCSVQILIHLGNLLCELVTSLQHCTLVLLDEPIYYRQISAL